MKLLSIIGLLSILLSFQVGFKVVNAEESVQSEQVEQKIESESSSSPESEAAPQFNFKVDPEPQAKQENFQELVTATTTFAKEPARLVYGRNVDFVVHVTNNSSQNVFVVGLKLSYPGRNKINFNPIQIVQAVGAGKSEDVKGSFTCELDVTKVDFAVHVLLHNPADHPNPFKIEAFSGSLPVHRPGNNWLDFQSFGIYAMLAVLGYFSYIWIGSRYSMSSATSGRAIREKRTKEKKAASTSQSPDTEWIPKHHFQMGQQKLRSTAGTISEQTSTSSLSLSDSPVTSEDESVLRKQK